MTGKRQHFIPRFLQKGFASHVVGEEVFTWAYRKGKTPFNANIKNVGVEGFFYSENSDTDLDDTITVAEDDFAQLIDKIRNNNYVDKQDYKKIAQLISHLELRTRHLRQNFFSTGNNLIDKMLYYLSDSAFCEKFLRDRIIDDPSLIKETFADELQKRGISQVALPLLLRMSKPFLESTIPNMMQFMNELIAHSKKEMPSILKQASKTGHIKALNRGLAPPVKVNLLEKYKYSVFSCKNTPIPLGDSVLIFYVVGDRSFKPFLEKKDDLIAVLLPVSSEQIIVGYKDNYVPNYSLLPEIIAECSMEYFIAGEFRPEYEQVSGKISENSHLLTEIQMESLINELMNGSRSNKANSADAKSRAAD
ncbi:DUF4238 domain-containing protein [uncultured Desulfosarcina sp.]|uniref:DUF4238 domain-containing protein n=1 Tax=uncultured Desulfosarcina sp. TaxID=218289 RepID=UPI0029C9476E|nr:DUF4238 domain-containing protein [uncultured Desulfosarcina sp.]